MLFLFPVLENLASLIMNQTFEGAQQSHLQLIMPNHNQKGCFRCLFSSEGCGEGKGKAGAYRGNATRLEEKGGRTNFLIREPFRGLNPHLLAYIKG